MLFLHRRHKKFKRTTQIAIVMFFVAIGLAIIDTIWALYLDSFGLTESQVGFVSSIFVFVSLLSSLFFIPILERFNENRIIVYSLAISIISYLGIAFFNNLYAFIILAIIVTIVSNLRSDTMDIVFRDNTKKSELNSAEGFLYQMLNIGWLVGPFIAGFFMLFLHISRVFISAVFFLFIGLSLFIMLHLKEVKKTRDVIHDNILKNIRAFIVNKKLWMPYMIAAAIEFWWALSYIYVPLFIINAGLGVHYVSIFFALIVVPLVLLEYRAGVLSEKYGFKPFFIFSFAGLAVSSFLLFLIDDIKIQLVILVLSSVFMAFLEPLQDSFFFRQVKLKDEERFYPIYGTATSIGSFMGKIVIAVVLLFFSSKFAYLAMGFSMILFLIPAVLYKK